MTYVTTFENKNIFMKTIKICDQPDNQQFELMRSLLLVLNASHILTTQAVTTVSSFIGVMPDPFVWMKRRHLTGNIQDVIQTPVILHTCGIIHQGCQVDAKNVYYLGGA